MSSSDEILSILTPTFQELFIQLSTNRPEDPILYTATFFKSKCNNVNDNEELYNNIFILLYRSSYKTIEFNINVNQAYNLLDPKSRILYLCYYFNHLDISGLFGILVFDFKKLIFKLTTSFHKDIVNDLLNEYIKSSDSIVTYPTFYQAVLTCVKCQGIS